MKGNKPTKRCLEALTILKEKGHLSSRAFNLSFETTVLAYDIPEENREAFFKNLIIRSIEQAFSNVKLNRG